MSMKRADERYSKSGRSARVSSEAVPEPSDLGWVPNTARLRGQVLTSLSQGCPSFEQANRLLNKRKGLRVRYQPTWVIAVLDPAERGRWTDTPTLPNCPPTPVSHPLDDQSALKLSRGTHHLSDEGPVRIAGIILRYLTQSDVKYGSISPPSRGQQRLLGGELPR